jgi:hypothetical protein
MENHMSPSLDTETAREPELVRVPLAKIGSFGAQMPLSTTSSRRRPFCCVESVTELSEPDWPPRSSRIATRTSVTLPRTTTTGPKPFFQRVDCRVPFISAVRP